MEKSNLAQKIEAIWAENSGIIEKRLQSWITTLEQAEVAFIETRNQIRLTSRLTMHVPIGESKKLQAEIRYLGRKKAYVIFEKSNIALKILKKLEIMKKSGRTEIISSGTYLWISPEANYFRSHYSKLPYKEGKNNELVIESKFVSEMLTSDRFCRKMLSLRPVLLMNKYRLQLPLPISGNTGKPEIFRGKGSGHIDILARHKSNEYSIWELKQPGAYKKAAAQAYIYAYTLLKIFRSSQSGQRWLNWVCGRAPKKTGDIEMPKHLKLRCVVAITEDKKQNFEDEIKSLQLDSKINNDEISLHVTFYKETYQGKKARICLLNNPFETNFLL